MLAFRILKAGFFILGALFGILLASTLNVAFLHDLVSGITSGNHVGYVIMAIFAIFFGVLFYCFEERIIIVSTAFIGSYLLFYGIGYFAGGFPDTFNIGQSNSYSNIESVPHVWYAYFVAILVWTGVGIYVQYGGGRGKSLAKYACR